MLILHIVRHNDKKCPVSSNYVILDIIMQRNNDPIDVMHYAPCPLDQISKIFKL